MASPTTVASAGATIAPCLIEGALRPDVTVLTTRAGSAEILIPGAGGYTGSNDRLLSIQAAIEVPHKTIAEFQEHRPGEEAAMSDYEPDFERLSDSHLSMVKRVTQHPVSQGQ